MKKITLVLFAIGTAAFVFLPVLRAEIVDRVAAVVNDEVITQSEVDVLLRPWYEQYKNTYRGEELATKITEVRRNLLNQLIEDRLVYQESKKRKIEILDDEVDERILEFKRRFKNEEEFTRLMNAQGLTLNKLRERYRQQLAIRRLHLMEVRSRVLVSPKEIEDYFGSHPNDFNQPEKVKLRSITLRKAPDKQGKVDPSAQSKAGQILTDLKKGADFAKIAEAHSEDYNASSGGEMGFVGRGEMARQIDEVVFALTPPDLSPVIETDIGYHIFKVEERQQGKMRGLEEVRPEIREILFREKAKNRFEEWMKELKAKAYISIR